MDCDKASEYMMKFMDGLLAEKEAVVLHKHVEGCAGCKEDFIIYSQILMNFEVDTEAEAPVGFVEAVMARIDVLPVHAVIKTGAGDTVLCAVWGTVSVMLGLGSLLVLNRDSVIAFVSSQPGLSAYADALTPVTAYMTELADNFGLVFQSAITAAAGFVGWIKYVCLASFVILAIVQFFLYRRGKVEA